MAVDQKMDPFTGPSSEGYKGKHYSAYRSCAVRALTGISVNRRQGLRAAVDVQFVIERSEVDRFKSERVWDETLGEGRQGVVRSLEGGGRQFIQMAEKASRRLGPSWCGFGRERR